jgi:hypothetical protein
MSKLKYPLFNGGQADGSPAMLILISAFSARTFLSLPLIQIIDGD